MKEDDQQASSSSTFEQTSKGVNGQNDPKNQIPNSKVNFDPIEAARQIKNVIGIGQTPKSSTVDQQQQKSKVTGQSFNTKLTPPLTQARIPQQPVIFTDHFDGGVNKLDIQFGNLDDSSSASSTAMFYQQQKQNDSISSNKLSQRTTVPQQTNAHISPATRPNDQQQPVMNTQRVLQTQQQQQQPSMTMKPIVTPQYTVHQQQPAPHQLNAQNLLFQSLLYHQQTQQTEPVTLDTSYDPTGFPLQSIDLTSPYFMAAAPPPQQQTQPRYIVSQGPPPLPPQQQQQQQQAGGAGTKNVQTTAGSASTNSTTTKKGPAIPPGMFPPTGPPPMPQQSAYSAAYGVQQQAGGAAYSTPYETEHLFANPFVSLNNAQQTQSPTGAYGSVTPPNQQQQQANANNENKALK